jgi:alpha-tubulin suppressor-like RCC1 family protein
MALTQQGLVFIWGSAGDGKLGTGADVDALHPVQLRVFDGPLAARIIACGADHSAVLTKGIFCSHLFLFVFFFLTYHPPLLPEGQLYMWGYGQHGVLGAGSELVTQRTPLAVLQQLSNRIQWVQCGMDMSLALVSS